MTPRVPIPPGRLQNIKLLGVEQDLKAVILKTAKKTIAAYKSNGVSLMDCANAINATAEMLTKLANEVRQEAIKEAAKS